MALRRKLHNEHPNKKLPIEHSGWWPYVARYLEEGRLHGYSEDTMRRHDSGLRRFVVWCEERSLDDPKMVTRPMLERYQSQLFYYRKRDGQPLTTMTQRSLMATVKNLFKWLTRNNYTLYNPASEIILPRKQRRLIRSVLTVDEVERVLAAMDLTNPAQLRDRAMVEVLYATGMRRSELTRIKLYDIDFARGAALIREGKGSKDRYVPLGERVQRWLLRYLDEVRPLLVLSPDDGTVFLADWGEAFAPSYVNYLVRRYIVQAGIDKPGACHLFRHAMATHMLENGADVRFIQALLGHADISTTQIYTHVSIDKLRQIHAATHPGELADRQALLAQLDTEAVEDD
jgi:integrase/recombinase XerD